MAKFIGTGGDDFITPFRISAGVEAPRNVKPSDAADTILGGGGNDVLDGFGGRDEIHGGDGRDRISGDGAVYGDGGNDTIRTYGTVDTLAHGGEGNDKFYGYADSGTLTLYGDAGDDDLQVKSDDGDPRVLLYGGDGNDTLQATSNYNNAPFAAGDNALHGGRGDDTYIVFSGADKVIETAGNGTDTVRSWADFVLPTNVENLTLLMSEYVSYGNVEGTGNGGDNVIRGNSEDNRIDGLAGDDTIYGRADGLPQSDIYGDAHTDADVIHGGAGNDTIHGGDGKPTWDGGDRLYGDAGNDVIHGDAGADLLYGGEGSDHLYGDTGNDVVSGGLGRDFLSGGGGRDVFDYRSIAESAAGAERDEILDFAHGASGDRIDLSAIDASSAAGFQHFSYVSGPLGAAQLHVVDARSSGASVIEGEVDGKAGVDFSIVVQDGAAHDAKDWSAADFILS